MRILTFMGAIALLSFVISCGSDEPSGKNKLTLKIDGEVIDLSQANLFLVVDSEEDFIDDEIEATTHGVFRVIATDADSPYQGDYAYRLEFTGMYPIAGEVGGNYRLLHYDEYYTGPSPVYLNNANEFAMNMELWIKRGAEDDWYGWDDMEVDGTMEVTSDGDMIKMVSSGNFERWRTVEGEFASVADELDIPFSLTAEGELQDPPAEMEL